MVTTLKIEDYQQLKLKRLRLRNIRLLTEIHRSECLLRQGEICTRLEHHLTNAPVVRRLSKQMRHAKHIAIKFYEMLCEAGVEIPPTLLEEYQQASMIS